MNEGYQRVPLTPADEANIFEIMRGYWLKRAAVRELVFDTPGDHIVDE
jgi:hypothetical protein